MKIGSRKHIRPHSTAQATCILLMLVFLNLGFRAGASAIPSSLSETEESIAKEASLNRSVASAINALGVFLYENGRLDEAEVRFREALSYSADHAGARKNLAMIFLGQSRFKEIIDLYPNAAPDQVSDVPLLTALAISQYASGEYQKAVPYFERLYADEVTKPELEIMLAVALDLTGAAARSQEVLDRLDKSDQIEAGYHVFKGDALRDRGRVQEAIVEYERALAIRSTLPTVPYRLGVLYSDTHQYEEALQAFQKELEINPTNADAAYSVGAYYLIWGQDLAKAREFFQRSISSDAESIGGYLGLMKVALAEESPDKAIEVAQKAEDLGLEHPELYYLKARALRLKGEEERAEEALHRFEQLNSESKGRDKAEVKD